jgi:transketolase
MRIRFIETLCAEAEYNPKIFLVCGDLGFSVLEPFATRFPDRYLNAGVAEQNMMGVAAGLAMTGYTVFAYSIGNFPTMRCLEQIRNDVCYHNADVKVVAVGSGFAYGGQGYTHHAVEDVAVMAALPRMEVFSPADPAEVVAVTRLIARSGQPSYLRPQSWMHASRGS